MGKDIFETCFLPLYQSISYILTFDTSSTGATQPKTLVRKHLSVFW
jgi:hypothetical protein